MRVKCRLIVCRMGADESRLDFHQLSASIDQSPNALVRSPLLFFSALSASWRCVMKIGSPRGCRTWPWCSASSWRTTWPWGPSLRGWSARRGASANRAASASAFPSTPRSRPLDTSSIRASQDPKMSAVFRWYVRPRATIACPENRSVFLLS